MSKNKLIPELRFPEFRNESEWRYLHGDKLFDPISNKNHNSDLPILAITQDQGAIPRERIDYHVSVSENSVKSYKVVEVGDFIISLRSFQGGIEYSNYLGLCSPAYIILRRKTDLFNDFYRHYFKSFLFIQDLNKNLEGIRDGKMISYKQFSDILIPNPRKEEQKKIASCLGSLDELIAAHTEKLDALNEHKKGLMQNLFPQEGQTLPKFSFSEGAFWNEVSLPKVVFFQEGPGIMKEDFHLDGVPLVRLAGIGSPEATLDGCNFLDPEKVISKWSHFRLDINDLVISTSATFGLSSVVTEAVAGAVFYTGLIRIRPTDECLDRNYLKFYLESSHFESQVKLSAVGGGIRHFGPTHLKQMVLNYPISLDEQKKIAACLSAVDELISAQYKKIDELKEHKKGLMQGLFPRTEN